MSDEMREEMCRLKTNIMLKLGKKTILESIVRYDLMISFILLYKTYMFSTYATN